MKKISFIFSLFFMSCVPNKKEKHIIATETKTFADRIVEKSIKYHGGIALWKNIKMIRFTKEIVLFSKDGTVESKQIQEQQFYFNPNLEGTIHWEKGKNKHIVRFKNETISKTINGVAITDSIALQSARNLFFSADYVINQPFKLKDKSILLKYIGVEKLNRKEYDAIEVRYKGDDETSDVWTYFFDIKTGQLNATMVVHNGKTSLIKNRTFNKVSGLLFHKHRESFFTDSIGVVHSLRATYFYDNFVIKFKE